MSQRNGAACRACLATPCSQTHIHKRLRVKGLVAGAERERGGEREGREGCQERSHVHCPPSFPHFLSLSLFEKEAEPVENAMREFFCFLSSHTLAPSRCRVPAFLPHARALARRTHTHTHLCTRAETCSHTSIHTHSRPAHSLADQEWRCTSPRAAFRP